MASDLLLTPLGRLRGVSDEEVVSYRGIPFARPPVGDLRFRAPQPVEAWRGVRDATEFGPIAPQPTFGLGSYVPGDPTEQSEDCLTCNVWAPAARAGAKTSLPVLVFFHGGSFVTGSGAGVMYRGDRLARRGVVVVTANYRLGALGFLAHRRLGEDGELCANFGLADQLALLAWVKANIAAFGGDARNVTCVGQSAGAMSVADLLVAPAARGLFQRAVLQSGAEVADEMDVAERLAERFFAELSLRAPTRRQLQSVPLEELIGAQVRASRSEHEALLSFKPAVDGELLARPPTCAFAEGASAGVDVLFGTNRDEFKFFTFAAPRLRELDEATLEHIIGRYLHDGRALQAADIVDFYRGGQRHGIPASPRDLLDAIATDVFFRLPLDRLAIAHVRQGGRAFAYRFDWPSPLADGALGACHGLELPFVFGTLDNPAIAAFAGATDAARLLSDAMQAAWVAFAQRGDPSTGALGDWPAFELHARATMVLDSASQVVSAPGEVERVYWEERLPGYGEPRPHAGGDLVEQMRDGGEGT